MAEIHMHVTIEKNYKVAAGGLPWIAIIIGAICGWLATNTVEGLAIGVLCGIIISLATYLGLIPILGVVLYDIVVRALFTWAGMDIPILYWFGLIFAAIFTAFASFYLIKFIVEKCEG